MKNPIFTVAACLFSLLAPSSAGLADHLEAEIQADPAMHGCSVNIRIESGIALLKGETPTLDQAERAAARTMTATGVRAVVNQLQVSPLPAGSKALRNHVRAVLKSQSVVDSKKIIATVSGSRVILEGEVGSLDEHQLAREIVSEVPGVAAIDNGLVVNFESVRSDRQMEEQLKRMIADDPLYRGLSLDVAVRDGVASLSGMVGSREEYDRLVRRCYITGVVEVETSDFNIDGSLAVAGVEDKNYTKEEVLVALNDALRADDRVDSTGVKADMRDGLLGIGGVVSSVAAKEAVEATARVLPGIVDISNNLQVRVDTPPAAASPKLAKKR